jgi:hypothetical protein
MYKKTTSLRQTLHPWDESKFVKNVKMTQNSIWTKEKQKEVLEQIAVKLSIQHNEKHTKIRDCIGATLYHQLMIEMVDVGDQCLLCIALRGLQYNLQQTLVLLASSARYSKTRRLVQCHKDRSCA